MNYVLKGLGFELKDLYVKIYPYNLDKKATSERMLKAYKIFENAKQTNKINKKLFDEEEQLNKLVTYKNETDDEVIKRYLEKDKKIVLQFICCIIIIKEVYYGKNYIQ